MKSILTVQIDLMMTILRRSIKNTLYRSSYHLTRGQPRSGRIGRGEDCCCIFEKSGSFQSHSPKPEGRAKTLRGQRPRVLHGKTVPSTIPPDDYAYRLIDPTIARRSRACLLATGTESGWTPGGHRQRGRGRPYRPKKGSQSLNTGCNPACRTAAATSPTGRSSWMANCSSSSLSPSA